MLIAVDGAICGPKGQLTHITPQKRVGGEKGWWGKSSVCSQNADCKALICKHLL